MLTGNHLQRVHWIYLYLEKKTTELKHVCVGDINKYQYIVEII